MSERVCCPEGEPFLYCDDGVWLFGGEAAYIKFCPFCGEKLAVPIDGSTTTKEIK